MGRPKYYGTQKFIKMVSKRQFPRVLKVDSRLGGNYTKIAKPKFLEIIGLDGLNNRENNHQNT